MNLNLRQRTTVYLYPTFAIFEQLPLFSKLCPVRLFLRGRKLVDESVTKGARARVGIQSGLQFTLSFRFSSPFYLMFNGVVDVAPRRAGAVIPLYKDIRIVDAVRALGASICDRGCCRFGTVHRRRLATLLVDYLQPRNGTILDYKADFLIF